MLIRQGTIDDIESISSIYERIHDQEENNITTIGWIRGVYPTKQTALEILNANELFVMEDANKIVGACRINQVQVAEYANAKWNYNCHDKEVMVLHTLVIDPLAQHKGYGEAFVAYYEKYAKDNGCNYLRMDTNAINVKARKLYQKLGYIEADIVPCNFNGIPNIQLVCLEKYIGD